MTKITILWTMERESFGCASKRSGLSANKLYTQFARFLENTFRKQFVLYFFITAFCWHRTFCREDDVCCLSIFTLLFFVMIENVRNNYGLETYVLQFNWLTPWTSSEAEQKWVWCHCFKMRWVHYVTDIDCSDW